MKIKEIRKFDIEITKDSNIIYSGISDDAPEDIKNMEIKKIDLINKVIQIEVEP